MSKAFDKMNPNTLIEKLRDLSINEGLISLIDNFLTDRQCCVKLKEKSEYQEITMGAPQGTKLAPWLWLVYVNDLDPPCQLVKYADDLTMFASFNKTHNNSEFYQHELDCIDKWATDNDMIINSKKSKVLHISLTKPKYTNEFTLGGEVIEICESSKLLGVILDNTLNFTEHVDDICTRLASKLYGMRVLKRLGMNRKGLKTYYIANIRPVLTYASPAWTSLISDHNMQKIIQIEKSVMKIINSDASYHEALCEVNLSPLDVYITETGERYIRFIYDNEDHPLNPNIVRNNQRQTRVSSLTYMPRCRTSKLQNSFFHTYSDTISN